MITAFTDSLAQAEDKIKMYYNNEELTKVIEVYSKVSGQKFVVDPSVRGKISIYLQEPISVEEAFNHLSSALFAVIFQIINYIERVPDSIGICISVLNLFQFLKFFIRQLKIAGIF